MAKRLFILADAACGSGRRCNAPRLADALVKALGDFAAGLNRGN